MHDPDDDQAILDTANTFRSEVESAAVNPSYPWGHMVPRRPGDPMIPRHRHRRREKPRTDPHAVNVRAFIVVVVCLVALTWIGLKLARVI